MTSSKPFSQSLERIRRPFSVWMSAFGWLLLILAFGLSSPAIGQEDDFEDDEFGDPIEQSAKEALALLTDNQKRVVNASPDISALRMALDGNSAVDTSRAANEARASLSITAGLVSESGGLDVTRELTRMQDAQEGLLSLLGDHSGAGQKGITSERSTGLVLAFSEAERKANGMLPLTAAERQTILLDYRNRIQQGHLDAQGEAAASGIDLDDDGRPIGRQELEKKQEKYAEWLAENERREREIKKKKAERAKRIQARQGRQDKGLEAPSVGLRKEAMAKPLREKPSSKMLEKMEIWHIRWSTKSETLKAALAKFLPLSLKRHDTKTISVCRHLYNSVVAISTDTKIMSAPDRELREALNTSILAMQEMSYSCIYGKFDETRQHRKESQTALGQAVKRMKVYGLTF